MPNKQQKQQTKTNPQPEGVQPSVQSSQNSITLTNSRGEQVIIEFQDNGWLVIKNVTQGLDGQVHGEATDMIRRPGTKPDFS